MSAGSSRTAQTGDRRNAAAPHLLSAGETPQRNKQENGKLWAGAARDSPAGKGPSIRGYFGVQKHEQGLSHSA